MATQFISARVRPRVVARSGPCPLSAGRGAGAGTGEIRNDQPFVGCSQHGIYFIARQNEPWQTVRFLSLATHEVTDMVRLEREPDWTFLGLAMSPDGRYLLTVQIDREANDLMMIENFR